MKHNKKRNTAFIFEALARDLTKSIVEKDTQRKEKVVSILKENFSRGQLLAEELELYNILLKTKNIDEKLAERILQETKSAYGHLDEGAVFDAKSRLISSINKELGQEIWATFVPNFKSLASVDAVLNSKASIKKKVLFEQALVDKMSSRESSDAEEMQPLDNLTYNSFINKFNDKYDDLLQEQKDLLNRFITSFSDDGFELRVYLNEELSRLKNSLSEAQETSLPLVAEKSTAVLEYLEEFRRREFADDDLKKVLKTQQLVRELAIND